MGEAYPSHIPTNMEAEEADDVEEDGEDIGGEPDWETWLEGMEGELGREWVSILPLFFLVCVCAVAYFFLF